MYRMCCYQTRGSCEGAWGGLRGEKKQEEKGLTEDEIVGWHHRLNGDEFEQTLGDSEGQGSLACCKSMRLLSQT